ncbi:hypothetical protein WA158_004014 [Blastocystis sp. Blastoise]
MGLRPKDEIKAMLNTYYTSQGIPKQLARQITDYTLKSIVVREAEVLQDLKRNIEKFPLAIETLLLQSLPDDIKKKLLLKLYEGIIESHTMQLLKNALNRTAYDSFETSVLMSLTSRTVDSGVPIFNSLYDKSRSWMGFIYIRDGTCTLKFANKESSMNAHEVIDIMKCQSDTLYYDDQPINSNDVELISSSKLVFVVYSKADFKNTITNCSLSKEDKDLIYSTVTTYEVEMEKKAFETKEKEIKLRQLKINQMNEAIKKNDMTMIKTLVEEGFDVNSIINGNQETFLYIAIHNQNMDIVQYFIEKGVDLKHTTQKNWTVLAFAVSLSWIQGVEYLISIGCQAPPTKDGETILHIAVQNTKKQFIKQLMDVIKKYKFDVDVLAKNNNGSTAFELTDDVEIKRLIRPKTTFGYKYER